MRYVDLIRILTMTSCLLLLGFVLTREFPQLYKAPMVFIPKMPSLGLLLEEPLFNSYNGRMTVHNQNYKPTDADYRPLIDFDLHREKIDAFKEEFIYKNMRGIEDRSGL